MEYYNIMMNFFYKIPFFEKSSIVYKTQRQLHSILSKTHFIQINFLPSFCAPHYIQQKMTHYSLQSLPLDADNGKLHKSNK